MLVRILAVLVPILFALVLRNPLEHDNVFSVNTLLHSESITPSPARVLIVTAHPDDESLFFAPTLISLLSHKHDGGLENAAPYAEVYTLCLSTGDADGLGKIRQQEMLRALDVLGIQEGKRWIVDNPNLQDNITAKWDPLVIADVVKPYVTEYKISTILTFDEKGISLHPNHISIPFGLRHLLSTQLPHPIPKLYTLISLPPFAKFQGPVAPVLAKYDLVLQHVWYSIYAYLFGTPSEVNPDDQISVPVFVSGAQEYLTALKSMYQHRSQLVWFRWLYIAASRYMWVNEWLEVKIPNSVTGV